MTRGDRIRGMTDEELAEMLTNTCDFDNQDDEDEPWKSIWFGEKENDVHDSYGDLLLWLKEEE